MTKNQTPTGSKPQTQSAGRAHKGWLRPYLLSHGKNVTFRLLRPF